MIRFFSRNLFFYEYFELIRFEMELSVNGKDGDSKWDIEDMTYIFMFCLVMKTVWLVTVDLRRGLALS